MSKALGVVSRSTKKKGTARSALKSGASTGKRRASTSRAKVNFVDAKLVVFDLAGKFDSAKRTGVMSKEQAKDRVVVDSGEGFALGGRAGFTKPVDKNIPLYDDEEEAYEALQQSKQQ